MASKIQLLTLLSPLLLTVSCMQASIDSLQTPKAEKSTLAESSRPKELPEVESMPVFQSEDAWEEPPLPKAKPKVADSDVPDEVREIMKDHFDTPAEADTAETVKLPDVVPIPVPRPEQGVTTKVENETKPEVKAEVKPVPKPVAEVEKPVEKPSEKPSETPVQVTAAEAKADMSEAGTLKPTVYYFAVINEDESKCTKDTKLHGSGGKVFLTVCKKTADACGLQGSCGVVQNGKTHTFNIVGRTNGQDRYFEIEKDGCRYGYGVRSSCLDPFYTLAADLSIYKPGDVIFVPGVTGTVLPDGSKHSGYFVIRDKGRGIKGKGRFDFFSGPMSWIDTKNPFNKLGLTDVKTNIPYFRVRGKTAKQVLAHRAYPELPRHIALSRAQK